MWLTAVICTRNRPDQIGRAVASVLANDHPTFDLVVVDQSSSDATEQALHGLIAAHPNLTYIHTTRVGLSSAYNIAIAAARGEALAFTDDDCVAPKDWLQRIEQAFECEPEAELLYGQVLAPADLRDAPGVVPTLPITASRRLSRRDGFQIYGMGANFAARRRLFERIGGFDEILGGGGPLRSSQDFDLQYRVYRCGLITLLAPEVRVDHHGWRSNAEWPQTWVAYGVGNGGFYMKHIRCGDLFVARLLARDAFVAVARLAKKRVLQRPHSWDSIYVCGLFRGLRDSFKFPIDHSQRLYVRR